MRGKITRLVVRVFGLTLYVGAFWALGMTFYEAKALVLAMLGLFLAVLAFNQVGGFIFRLPFTEATKGTIALFTGIGAVALLQPSQPPRPTYAQALHIAQNEADTATYVEVAGSEACSDDCSGHEAGFQWAKENGVTQDWDCPSTRSKSFSEGCDAYAFLIDFSMNVQHWDSGFETADNGD